MGEFRPTDRGGAMEQVFLITGSSGMAKATALLAAHAGHAVFIAGMDESECRALAGEISNSAYSAGDLCDENAAERAFQSCLERFGKVDAVFNAAGVSGRKFGDGPVHECTLEGWRKTLEANTLPAFLMSRAVVRHWLAAQRGGAILNMSSVLALHPEPRHFATHAYAASKGAVISMSRAMAASYASHGIRVNVIAPGLVKTPMSARAQSDPQILEFIRQKQPLARGMLEASEVARVALFLLSEESGQMTSQVVEVDGGWAVSGY
jgi:NAD(P)-dependent dehydrogenase (short-subunit alcohol dehydrogenase family)